MSSGPGWPLPVRLIRFAPFRRCRSLRLVPQQPTGSMSEGDTAGGGDPARCALAGLVPATGQLAADRLGAQSGHCRCWWIRFVAFRRGRCQRLAPGLTGSMSEGDTAGAGGSGSRYSGGPVPAAGAKAADRLDV